MNFLDLVQRRQSTRRYAPGRRIPRDVLDRCLEAARLAPSACNSQPWSFVVVDDPDQVRALAQAACGHAPSYGGFLVKMIFLLFSTTHHDGPCRRAADKRSPSRLKRSQRRLRFVPPFHLP